MRHQFFFFFFKFFFSKQYTKLLFNNNLKYLGNYTNNLTKSFLYNIYFNLFIYFKNTIYFNKYNSSFANYLSNLYFLPIKTLNIKLNNTFYKNIFFYLMLIYPSIWYQHTSFLKFYLNFIFINYTLKTSRFYNGHFLKIYNN